MKCFGSSLLKIIVMAVSLLFFSLMFSASSYAEWTRSGTNEHGDHFYVDFERIRKQDDYIYYWALADLKKPLSTGHRSVINYKEADCKSFRFRIVTWSLYKQSMGGGASDAYAGQEHKGWQYPNPNSAIENVLQSVCDR
jgi:hypothetical protein